MATDLKIEELKKQRNAMQEQVDFFAKKLHQLDEMLKSIELLKKKQEMEQYIHKCYSTQNEDEYVKILRVFKITPESVYFTARVINTVVEIKGVSLDDLTRMKEIEDTIYQSKFETLLEIEENFLDFSIEKDNEQIGSIIIKCEIGIPIDLEEIIPYIENTIAQIKDYSNF